MAGEVADGVHVHPLVSPDTRPPRGTQRCRGRSKIGRPPSDVAVIVPIMTIVVTPTNNGIKSVNSRARASAFTPARPITHSSWTKPDSKVRQREFARSKSVATTRHGVEITDDHLAAFATESTWDGLEDALVTKYEGIANRIVLYNALADPSTSSDMARLRDAFQPANHRS